MCISIDIHFEKAKEWENRLQKSLCGNSLRNRLGLTVQAVGGNFREKWLTLIRWVGHGKFDKNAFFSAFLAAQR